MLKTMGTNYERQGSMNGLRRKKTKTAEKKVGFQQHGRRSKEDRKTTSHKVRPKTLLVPLAQGIKH